VFHRQRRDGVWLKHECRPQCVRESSGVVAGVVAWCCCWPSRLTTPPHQPLRDCRLKKDLTRGNGKRLWTWRTDGRTPGQFKPETKAGRTKHLFSTFRHARPLSQWPLLPSSAGPFGRLGNSYA
jgi:hypothetical protein